MNFHPKLLNQSQMAKCTQLAGENDRDGKRAKALLALHNGSTLKEASELSGLTHGQVRYILERFRKIGFDSLAFKTVPERVTTTQTKITPADEKNEPPKIRTKARSKKKKKKVKEEKPRKSKKRKQKDKEKRKEKVKMRIKKEKEKRKKDKKDKDTELEKATKKTSKKLLKEAFK